MTGSLEGGRARTDRAVGSERVARGDE